MKKTKKKISFLQSISEELFVGSLVIILVVGMMYVSLGNTDSRQKNLYTADVSTTMTESSLPSIERPDPLLERCKDVQKWFVEDGDWTTRSGDTYELQECKRLFYGNNEENWKAGTTVISQEACNIIRQNLLPIGGWTERDSSSSEVEECKKSFYNNDEEQWSYQIDWYPSVERCEKIRKWFIEDGDWTARYGWDNEPRECKWLFYADNEENWISGTKVISKEYCQNVRKVFVYEDNWTVRNIPDTDISECKQLFYNNNEEQWSYKIDWYPSVERCEKVRKQFVEEGNWTERFGYMIEPEECKRLYYANHEENWISGTKVISKEYCNNIREVFVYNENWTARNIPSSDVIECKQSFYNNNENQWSYRVNWDPSIERCEDIRKWFVEDGNWTARFGSTYEPMECKKLFYGQGKKDWQTGKSLSYEDILIRVLKKKGIRSISTLNDGALTKDEFMSILNEINPSFLYPVDGGLLTYGDMVTFLEGAFDIPQKEGQNSLYEYSIIDNLLYDQSKRVSYTIVAKSLAHALIAESSPETYIRFDNGASAFSAYTMTDIESEIEMIVPFYGSTSTLDIIDIGKIPPVLGDFAGIDGGLISSDDFLEAQEEEDEETILSAKPDGMITFDDVIKLYKHYMNPEQYPLTSQESLHAAPTDLPPVPTFPLKENTVRFSFDGPSSSDIPIGASDVSLLNFTLASQTDITVKDLDIIVYADDDSDNDPFDAVEDSLGSATSDPDGLINTGTEANIKNIRIINLDTNKILMGPLSLDIAEAYGDDANQTIDFTDDVDIKAGQTLHLSVVVDIDNGISTGTEIGAALDISGFVAEDRSVNILTSQEVIPNNDLIGYAITTTDPSLTVSKNYTVSSGVKVRNSETEMFAFDMQAGESSEIQVQKITFTGLIDSNPKFANDFRVGSDTDVSNTYHFRDVVEYLTLYEDFVSPENKRGTVAYSDFDGRIVFKNLGLRIPSETIQTFIVTGKIANSSIYGEENTEVKIDIFDIDADIDSFDRSGNSLNERGYDFPNGGSEDNPDEYSQITIINSGTLAVTIPSTTVSSQVIVAGTTGNEMSTIRFSATLEPFVIRKLTLRNGYGTTAETYNYDDNIAALKVTYYTDASQTTQETRTCNSSGIQGVWNCSSLNIYVPNPEEGGGADSVDVTVLADLNSTANNRADLGDQPSFTFTAVGDFEAVGQFSGNKIYEETVLVPELGPLSTFETVRAYEAASDAAAYDLDVTGADRVLSVTDNDLYTEGSLICIDVADDGCGMTDEKAYVIARCTAPEIPHRDCRYDNDIVLYRGSSPRFSNEGLFGSFRAATSYNDDIDLLTPSTALVVPAMIVQGTKITVANNIMSSSGLYNESEEVMNFTFNTDSEGSAKIRQGMALTTATEGTDIGANFIVNTNETYGQQLDGSSTAITWTSYGDQPDSTIQFAATAGTLDDYARASFFVYWDDSSQDGDSDLLYENLSIFTSTNAEAINGQSMYFNGSCAEGAWCHIDIPLPPGTDASDDVFGIEIDEQGMGTNIEDILIIDDLKLYNEKIQMNLTLNEDVTTVGGTAYLKVNGIIVATAAVGWDAVTGGTDYESGTLLFVPTGGYDDIDLSGTDLFSVEIPTNIFREAPSSTERLTATINLGSSSYEGDIHWYDVEGANTVKFTGINDTDKISTTISY